MTNIVEKIFSNEITQQGIDELRGLYPESLKVDMSDELEFKAARKTRTERNKLVKSINKRRIDISNELKEYGDDLINQIEKIYDVVVLPFEAEDKRRKDEEKRIAKEREENLNKERTRIKELNAFYDDAKGKSSVDIAAIIESVDLIEVDVFDKELIHEAIEAKKVTLDKLSLLMSDTKNREALEKEREEMRIEKEKSEKRQAIIERINNLKMIPTTMFDKTADEIQKKLFNLRNFTVTKEYFGDMVSETKESLFVVIDQLTKMQQQQRIVEETRPTTEDKDEPEAIQEKKKTNLGQSLNKPEQHQEKTETKADPNSIKKVKVVSFLNLAANNEGLISDFVYMLLSKDNELSEQAAAVIKSKFDSFSQKYKG